MATSIDQPRAPRRASTPSSCVPETDLATQQIVVHGLVQGVGFRPFVYRLAIGMRLAGTVRNDGARVTITVRGTRRTLARFAHALAHEAPPLSRVERIDVAEVDTLPDEVAHHRFRIVESTGHPTASGSDLRLPPDAGICERCEAELMNPVDRRYRHLFISCTDCGPRWSMLETLPYDRVRTTMAPFPMCADCAREYADPADRRFHAESICCPHCGPRLEVHDASGASKGTGEHAIAAAVAVLRAGGIVAIHGIGGFHLAVDATNEEAVLRLRRRKHRPTKPLAVMVRTAAQLRQLVRLEAGSMPLLQRPERPVVVAPWMPDSRQVASIAPSVAPGLAELGVMLPSTALHHLLLHDVGGPLVMTSGNASGEPLAATPDEGLRDLQGIADVLLVHDRAVVAPSDDTVLRHADEGPVLLRRARGWSPAPQRLPLPAAEPMLALGADLKATVALAHGNIAWLSPHLGDQSSLAVQERTADTIARLVRLSGCVPTVVVGDAHPGYASTALLERWMAAPTVTPWAAWSGGAPFRVCRVQHHHAHVAAVLAEHGVLHPVVALAFDGAGWGLDGTVWGGEVMVGDLAHMQRVGTVMPAPLIGGDLAARVPWRAALGWLLETDGVALEAITAAVPPTHVQLARQLAQRAQVSRTSSMGRLFDAAAAVLQLTPVNSYEGEAATRLEAVAAPIAPRTGIAWPWVPAGATALDGPWRVDPREALERLAVRQRAGVPRAELAAMWHDDVAATSVRMALRALEEHAAALGPTPTVVLCGGVFQNVRLLALVRHALVARGLAVVTPRTLPANDGAIAYGQVAIAAAWGPNPSPAGSA